MSIVCFSESNVVKAIMYKNEIREDSVLCLFEYT